MKSRKRAKELHEQAQIARKQGDLILAEQLFKAESEELLNGNGHDKLDVVVSLYNRVQVLEEQGRWDEAVPVRKQAFDFLASRNGAAEAS